MPVAAGTARFDPESENCACLARVVRRRDRHDHQRGAVEKGPDRRRTEENLGRAGHGAGGSFLVWMRGMGDIR